MANEREKQRAGEAAIEYIKPGMSVGVGTGSTVGYFIEALKPMRHDIDAVVSSSEATTKQLKMAGFRVMELNATGNLDIYVDGADEVDEHKRMIKGGGAALTREKVIAAASDKFVCIVDASKKVDILGSFPVPVEVIPMARSYVAREIVKLGGQPEYRDDVITDNGNVILDVYNLKLLDPVEMEQRITQIAGVVTAGIFAKRTADIVLLASGDEVTTY